MPAGRTEQTTFQTLQPRPKTAPAPHGFYSQIAANSKNWQKPGAEIGKYFLGFLDIASGGCRVSKNAA